MVALIESCAKKKQDQLLSLVQQEDISWAKKIKSKILTVDRVLNLPQEGINEIFSKVPEKVLVFAMHGIAPEKHDLVLSTFTHFKRKTIIDLLEGSKPKADEIEAAFLQIFAKIRIMEKERMINLLKLAPELALGEKKSA